VVIFAVHPVTPQGTATITPAATAVVVIPARYDSTRLPGKPLAEIAGRPMVEHVYRRAASAVRPTSVLVATDDQRVYDAVTAFGGNVRLTQRHHRNGTERLGEVAHDLTSDLVVNLQADEPLVDPASIDLALSAFDGDPTLNMATLRTPITDPDDIADPHVVKVVVDRDDFALYFSRSAIPHIDSANSGRPGPTYQSSKHIGLYVYRRDLLLRLATLGPTPLEQLERLEQLRALEHGYRIKVLETTHDPIGVDTPQDLERVRRIVGAGASQ
jgi:3-deoxy-manno-octulosonate cytidylyltransferase (CMP-KDO synthetase)